MMRSSFTTLSAAALLAAGLAVGAAVPAQASVPAEYKDALAQARSYVRILDISKAKLYDQLHSPYGGDFPAKAAKYAVANVKADYNREALGAARSYRKILHLSRARIREQLVSKFGGKFTQANANYAMKHLG